MRQVWTSETECTIGDVPIRVANGGYDALRTTPDNVWVLKGRSFFEVLSATQTSRIEAAIAALPPEGKRTVLKFFVGMVESSDRGLLDRLRLTDEL